MINDNVDKVMPQADGKVPALRFPEFNNNKWKSFPIGEVLKIGSGKDYKHLTTGSIPVYGSGGLMTYVDKFLYDGESVCIGRKGTIDNPMLLSGKFWTVDTLFYTYDYKNLIPKFLFNIFQQIDWRRYSEASGVPSLSKSIIESIEIYIPSDTEQEKIAECLSSVDNLISTKQTELESLKKYKKGLLQQLFPQGNNNLPAIRFPEFKNMWIADKIINIADYVDYRGKTPEKVNQGIFLVTAKNIKMGYIDYNVSQEYVSRDDYEIVMRRGLPEIGDVLITTEAPLGNIASVDRKDVAFAQRVIKYRGKENILHNPFLKYIMLSDDFQKKIDNLSTGGTAKGIKGSTLHEIEIRFTSSWTEQKKIADCLTSLDNLINLKQQELNKLDCYKKGLLQQLLVQG